MSELGGKQIGVDAMRLRALLAHTPTPAGVTDHGSLVGLGDDDHGQYVHLSAARTITAQHTFAPASPQAPFALGAAAQGQLVAGLNADKLDGYEAAAFSLVGHTHDHGSLTGLGDDDHGAVYPGLAQSETITGLWTFDRDPGAPFAVSAGSAKVANLDADKLDGYEVAAFPRKAENAMITGTWAFPAAGFTIGADVALSRGAADRLDVPDALRIDSTNFVLQKDTGRWNAGGLRLQAIGTDDEARFMLMPSGTSSGSIVRFYNASDPDNVGAVELKLTNQAISFSALSWGTGSQPDRFVFPSDFKVAFGYSPDPVPARVSILDTAEQLRLSYDDANYTSFTVSSGGTLTVAPTGDLVLDPGGNDVLPGGSIEDDLGDYNRMWRTLFAAELYVETLVAQDVLATIGGRIMVAPTTKLIADVNASQTTIDVEHNNLANNDYALLKAAPGGVPQFEVMQVTSGPTTITGGYRYSVSRNKDGTGANSWYKGDAVALLGYAAGEGYIELTSTQTVHNHLGPNITIYSRTGTANWDDVAPTVSIGNLESFVDYSSDEFGVAAGDDLTTDPATGGFSGFSIDRTNGLRLWNTGIKLFDGANQRIEMDPTATGTGAMMWAGPSSTDKRFVVTGDGDVWLSTLAVSADLGAWLFSQADGLLLLDFQKIVDAGSNRYLVGSRGERAAHTGSLRRPYGRFPGTRGIAVDPAGTNYCTNPIMGDGNNPPTGWSGNGSNTVARSTDQVSVGVASLKCTYQDTANLACKMEITLPTASTTYTLQARVWVPDDWDGGEIRVSATGLSDGSVAYNDTWTTSDPTGRWFHLVATLTVGADTSCSIGIRLMPTYPSAGKFFYVDAVHLEETDAATALIHGDAGPGYTWSGTAHNSTSSRTATEINLDDLAGIPSNENQLSFSMWVQMPFDYNEDWIGDGSYTNKYIMELYEDIDNWIGIYYYKSGTTYRLYTRVEVGGTAIPIYTTASFTRGDWLNILATYDFSGKVTLYLNGKQVASDDMSSLSATSFSQWNLGDIYNATRQQGFVFGQCAVFDRVLTANEAAAIYALQRPLIDAGAFDKPGVYILDGEFRISSSQTGQRVDLRPEGIGIFDDTGETGVARLLGGRVDITSKTLDLEGDSLGWFGYDASDVLQVAWYAEGTDAGKIIAGGGDVILDEDGISIVQGALGKNKLKWLAGTDVIGWVNVEPDGATNRLGYFVVDDNGGNTNLILEARDSVSGDTVQLYLGSGSTSLGYGQGLRFFRSGERFSVDGSGNALLAGDLRVGQGLYVGGTAYNPPTDDVVVDGGIYLGRQADPGAGNVAFTGVLKSYKGTTEYSGYIFVPIMDGSTNTSYDGDTISSDQTVDLQSGWTTNIPADAKAVAVRISWSSDTVGRWVLVKARSSSEAAIVARTQVANVYVDASGIVNTYNGDIYLDVNGTGDVFLQVHGYFI